MENLNHVRNGVAVCESTEVCSSLTTGDQCKAGDLSKESLENTTKDSVTGELLSQQWSGDKQRQGEGSIAGLLVHSTNVKMSIYQAMKMHILSPGAALILLEAQAATGFLIDPVTDQQLSVDEALQAGIIGPDVYDKLASAEKALLGYKDPYTGDMLSLFQAMKKELVVNTHGIHLLEAQIATGGIIDPSSGHRIPMDVAYQRGMFDEEMNKILSDPSDDTRGFFDPNTRENLTYLQLKERCVTDPETGLCLLRMTDRRVKGQQSYSIVETRGAFQGEAMSVTCGKFKGKTVSVWDLIHSEYFTEEKRKELIEKYRRKEIDMKTIITTITTIIEQTETQTVTSITFTGLRSEISLQELMESENIDETTLQDLNIRA